MNLEKIRSISVIGFGLMGSQISQLLAQSGFQVVATDVSKGILGKGLEMVRKGRFGLEGLVRRGKITSDDSDMILRRIETTDDLGEACRRADFLIEAVSEDPEVKKRIFQEADRHCPSGIILASNTSTLNIAEIASATKRREKVIGMHFFNPPQIIKLVEVIRCAFTSQDTVLTVQELAKRLKKTPILVKDSPGFVASRLGISLFLEGSRILDEGVASVKDIDIAMRLGYGHPMGPFELADLVGLDTRLRNIDALYEATKEERWRGPPLLRQLVNSGYLGDPQSKLQTKGGYYEHFGLSRERADEQQ